MKNILAIVANSAEEDSFMYMCSSYSCTRAFCACSEHAHVSFVTQLRRLGLWPNIPSASEIKISASELREQIFNIEIKPYSRTHRFCCTKIMKTFRKSLLLINYDREEDRYGKHFAQCPDPGQETLYDHLGSPLSGYGFTAEDFGYTSYLEAMGRRPSGAVNDRTWVSFALQDELVHEDESDYETDSEASEPAEEYESDEPESDDSDESDEELPDCD